MSAADKPYVHSPERGPRLLPEAASEYATQVDQLYFALLALSGLLIVILTVLVAWFSLRYRSGRRGERGVLLSARSANRMELGFMVFLSVCFAVLFVWAAGLYLDVHERSKENFVVNIVAKQWMWKIQHPNGAREINSLHLPVGQEVELRIISQDVIHSFSVPALRVKRDALPGRYSHLRVTVNREGEYPLYCAEFCGTDHSGMRGRVVALSPSAYQQWLDAAAPGQSPEQRGAQLFADYGCASCHVGGSDAGRGPDLAGIYGRKVALSSGQSVWVDEDYLRTALIKPQAQIVAGYEPIMPSFQGQLSESDILALIAYLRSGVASDRGGLP